MKARWIGFGSNLGFLELFAANKSTSCDLAEVCKTFIRRFDSDPRLQYLAGKDLSARQKPTRMSRPRVTIPSEITICYNSGQAERDLQKLQRSASRNPHTDAVPHVQIRNLFRNRTVSAL